MNEAQTIKFLDLLGAANVAPSSTWVRCSCPFAPWKHRGTDENPSFGIELGSRSRYWCFGCSSSGNMLDLISELGSLSAGTLHTPSPQKSPWDISAAAEYLDTVESGYAPVPDYEVFPTEKNQIIPWSETLLTGFPRAVDVPEARSYLHHRNVADDTAEHFDIRWDQHRRCVAFPFRDMGGNFVGLRGRKIDPDPIKFHDYTFGPSNSSLVWHHENELNFNRPILLVESSFDACAVWPYESNVVAALTVALSAQKISRIGHAVGLICFFDHDQAGEYAYRKIERQLGSVPVQRVLPVGGKDANEMSPEKLKDLLT